MSDLVVGFDAVRALHNHTGLGNYARGVLRGLRAADPELRMHLYSPRPPAVDFRQLPREVRLFLILCDIAAHLHQRLTNFFEQIHIRLNLRLQRTTRLSRCV